MKSYLALPQAWQEALLNLSVPNCRTRAKVSFLMGSLIKKRRKRMRKKKYRKMRRRTRFQRRRGR